MGVVYGMVVERQQEDIATLEAGLELPSGF